MDSATPVDDAALARSRPLTASDSHQAEMLKVPNGQVKMRMHKLVIKNFSLFPILWIIIHQVTSASCASLKTTNYSSEHFNASSNQSNFSNPTNLSELIEYSPVSLEDDLRDWEQRIKDSKIVKVRLRTSLAVGNHDSASESAALDKFDGMMHPNASETPLSEIEFGDKFLDFLAGKPFSKRAARIMVYADNETDLLFDSDEELKSSEEDSSNDIPLASSESDEDRQTGRSNQLSKYARGRQFVFPPYMPANPFTTYDKDTPPDEKISFHDVLPVKAVKFIKSMVEDADWNGMFKSMVRTVVDHFVNKIIEKMFSEKDKDHDHFKKRSLDDLFPPASSFPSFLAPMVRLKRATHTNNPTDQIKDVFNMPPKRARQELDVVKKKNAQESMSWFDKFLDYVFPSQNPDKSDDGSSDDRLKKRDTTNSEFFNILLELFLKTFEKSSGIIKDAKDVLRPKMLKEISQYLHKYGHSSSSSNHADAMKMSHRKFEKSIPHSYGIENYVSARSMRKRRSTTRDYFRKMEDRLWQFHSHRHRPHSYSSREDCSLRKACNAGRLLARLPSIEEIAVQLSNGNEPHWDALIWGMKKKGCSRIFCKRHRSPKGSKKKPWNNEKDRLTKRILIVSEPPETFSETDNLTA